ncbi:VOC family protein [Actinomycetota bacterium]
MTATSAPFAVLGATFRLETTDLVGSTRWFAAVLGTEAIEISTELVEIPAFGDVYIQLALVPAQPSPATLVLAVDRLDSAIDHLNSLGHNPGQAVWVQDWFRIISVPAAEGHTLMLLEEGPSTA